MSLIAPVQIGDRLRSTLVRPNGGFERSLVRTRCALGSRRSRQASASSLDELIERLRARLEGLPLTVVAHGWARDNVTDQFVDTLLRSLRVHKDAVWLLPKEPVATQAAKETKEGAIILDLGNPTDARLYGNLHADVLFFPAASKEDARQAKRFAGRAETAIVDKLGPSRKKVWRRLAKLGWESYLWTGDSLLEPREGKTARPRKQIKKKKLERLGRGLLDEASKLEGTRFRRYRFGSRLREVLADNPEHATWNEDLLMLADRFGWPRWAVECIPTLSRVGGAGGGWLVPVEGAQEDRQRALLWDLILNCFPEEQRPPVLRRLCDGRILEVELDPERWDLAARMAESLQRSVGDSPYWGDGVFYSRLADALLDLIIVLRDSDPATARQIDSTRRELLREAKLPIRPGE